MLCSAVLMHLRREDLITAVLSLARILAPGGRLVLSYRCSRSTSEREADGRLFTAIERGRFILLLESAGFQVLFTEREADPERADIFWELLAAEKSPLDVARGLDRIQGILAQDRKSATYKLVLVRALCAVSRTKSHLVQWGTGEVFVPLWPIAVHWLAYYWPLMNAPQFIAQLRGEHPESIKPIAFRQQVRALAQQFGLGGLPLILRDIDERPERYRETLAAIAHTIRYNPVRYAGSGASPVFRFAAPHTVPNRPRDLISSLGGVVIPEAVWLDLSRFDHWIEDSVVLRWARLTAEMNRDGTPAEFLPLLLATPENARDTGEVSGLLRRRARLECVWSGQPLQGRMHIDHGIPFSVWGNNDLWNLLPCHPAVNGAKSDQLPSPRLIRRRQEVIVGYWREYRALRERRFDLQISQALGCDPRQDGWEEAALAGLRETVQRLATSRGLPLWEPH